MKFKGHESFAIRRGWLYKGLKNVRERADIFLAKDAMETLGLGSNMVKSLRYWMQATGLAMETSAGSHRVQRLTPLGELVWREDPYVEEAGTLWLLHAVLAQNEELATSWRFFFQAFPMQEFSKDDFVRALSGVADAAESSLSSDFDCIVATYLPRRLLRGKVDPESNIDCPLGALGLLGMVVTSERDKLYEKVRQLPSDIPPEIFMCVLLSVAEGRREWRLQEIFAGTEETDGLGGIFGLDFAGMLTVLYALERQGAVNIVRTAGLDLVRIASEEPPLRWAEHYYEGLVG